MKLINELGENLNFLIKCDYIYCHDWLSFISWYSINKYIPDSKISISCCRDAVSRQFFLWVKRANVDFYINKDISVENCIVIDPWVFAIREFKDNDVNCLNNSSSDNWESILCSSVRNEEFTPLVNCQEGVGNFVLSEWIHTLECPLSKMNRYMSLETNFNEFRVLNFMKQLAPLYFDISRG